jgi:hypothetical protein
MFHDDCDEKKHSPDEKKGKDKNERIFQELLSQQEMSWMKECLERHNELKNNLVEELEWKVKQTVVSEIIEEIEKAFIYTPQLGNNDDLTVMMSQNELPKNVYSSHLRVSKEGKEKEPKKHNSVRFRNDVHETNENRVNQEEVIALFGCLISISF